MGKKTTIWLIAAVSLIMIGCIMFVGVMSIMKWNFAELSTDKYITSEHQIHDSFTNISIDTATTDISFVPAADGICKAVCHEPENEKHSVTVENGTLTIRLVNEKKWYDYISIGTKTPKLTVYLPSNKYGTLVINENTGDIMIPLDFKFESMNITADTGDIKNQASVSGDMQIQTSTGAIHLENISANKLEVSVSTGRVTVSDILCNENFTLNVSTGKANLNNIQCRNLVTTGDTGDISLEKVIAEKTFTILRSTGDVTLNGCDAEEILIETDTGDVTGTLLTEKVFSAQSNTGKVRIPSTSSGGNCVVITSTGKIIISVSSS